jgi:hypothetical protein
MILTLFSRMLPPKFRFPVQYVGAVSTRPGLPLSVSRTPSANFPVWFPDREDPSLSGFSLVLSDSDLLSDKVALPLDGFSFS